VAMGRRGGGWGGEITGVWESGSDYTKEWGCSAWKSRTNKKRGVQGWAPKREYSQQNSNNKKTGGRGKGKKKKKIIK